LEAKAEEKIFSPKIRKEKLLNKIKVVECAIKSPMQTVHKFWIA
jgi:hypothetical protein